jgi:predicted dehydrogenase
MTQFRASISRRRFVQGTAATIALPLFVPTHVLGDDSNASANQKIRVGAIGCGKQMGGLLPASLRSPEIQVVAVCDVDTTRREAAKKRVDDAYGNTSCAAYVDFREIMARDDIDAVVCATPDHWHAGVILAAAAAGKDIYCEKPLTNTLREAKLAMDAVNQSGIILQTGSQQRSEANFRYACELVQNGRLGKIKQVMVSVGGPPRPCNLPGEELEPGLDWDRWLGPAPMREYSSVLSPRGIHNHFPSWRNFCEYGGGMTDWGAHHFDIAQWGLGMDQSGPDDIIKQPIGENEIQLYKSPGGGHFRDWVNCMLSREQPNCPIEIGARTVAVCHLGNIMYLHRKELGGNSLKWDPAKWEFVGNDEANRWQDYPYPRRAGYELPG